MLISSILLLFILLITQVDACLSPPTSCFSVTSKSHANKYRIDGIKCKSCEDKVINILKQYDTNVTLLSNDTVEIAPNSTIDVINTALQAVGTYSIKQQQSTITNIIQLIIQYIPLVLTIALYAILVAVLLYIYLIITIINDILPNRKL